MRIKKVLTFLFPRREKVHLNVLFTSSMPYQNVSNMVLGKFPWSSFPLVNSTPSQFLNAPAEKYPWLISFLIQKLPITIGEFYMLVHK